MTLRETVVEGVSDNFRTLAAGALIYVGGVEAGVIGGYPTLPTLPEESRLLVTLGLAAGATGLLVASRVRGWFADPEQPGDRLVVVNAMRDDRIAVWELPEEGEGSLSELTVVGGPLNHLPGSLGNAYEVLAYDPERNVAVSTWRMSEPDSTFVGQETYGGVICEIEDLRTRLEPRARAGRVIRQQLPGIVRDIDRARFEAINAALRGDVAPDLGATPVDEIIRANIPDAHRPARLAYDREETLREALNDPEEDETDAGEALALLDDADEVEVTAVASAATDGGTEEG